jgi:hypothetical protein
MPMRACGLGLMCAALLAIRLGPPETGVGMSQVQQQTLANVTAIAFGLCSLIAAGVIFATHI